MSMKPCPETFPYPLIALDETDSTNRYISQLCNELQESVAEPEARCYSRWRWGKSS